MEKSSSNSKELQCVGKLEIVRPKAAGFLCGSIPVTLPHHDKPFASPSSALVTSSQTVSGPRYRMLPTETDLNTPPDNVRSTLPDEGVPWDDGAITSNLSRKGEALAVSGLVEYDDEMDVIAPADIVKQIFKMPYSKARLSIAVHRVGKTLVLNAGPDVEEGEKLVRRNQRNCSDESLLLNFAKQSVRMEACDCPPTYSTPAKEHSKSSVLPDSRSSFPKFSQFGDDKIAPKGGHDGQSDYSKGKHYWDGKKNKRNKAPRSPVREPEKYRRDGNDEFSRVLLWKFHDFRMLLGSDLLVFSNEKYVSVSLHLWDISRQVTPLTWLEAWLDNLMASVPELAICYHRNGLVKSYELLKTDDIFLLKGVSEDGSPAFHPYVVQQNGLSVLRFLKTNCKQDPGAYWLYKNAGEDVIQLFDLSVIPKNHSSESDDDCSNPLPYLVHRGRAESLLSLGTLLYRIAHRLSLSMTPNNRFRCARFIRKCLELLDEPDHLVVRAYAHEQFARLILYSDEELDLAEEIPLASEVVLADQEEESLDIVSCISESSIQGSSCSDLNNSLDSISEASGGDTGDLNVSVNNGFSGPELLHANSLFQHQQEDWGYNMYNATSTPADIIQTTADSISSKLAAVRHISQAIKSLRLTRQLQGAEDEPDLVNDGTGSVHHPDLSSSLSVCACGDTDCIEVCDIREWLPTSKVDHKLWKLILLLGESYLALGQAYKEDAQLLQALKVVEVACSVYGSVPQYLEDAKFISSMGRQEKQGSLISYRVKLSKNCYGNHMDVKDFSSTYLFWAKAWMLVGDVYVDFLSLQGKQIPSPTTQSTSGQELRMSSEVVKELIRLKKKLGKDAENCSTCSLVNCSCQSDRASSGNSTSSSGGEINSFIHSRRQGKKSFPKNAVTSLSGNSENNYVQRQGDSGTNSEGLNHKVAETNNMITVQDEEQDLVSTQGESSSASITMKDAGRASDVAGAGSSKGETTSRESPKTRNGGIFNFVQGPGNTNTDDILSVALTCYEAAGKALGELSAGSPELQSVLKKIGWVCNELGRNRLAKKTLSSAEVAFSKAIDAFREVSDHTNIILINCNLGHGRRALAEEWVSKMEYLKSNAILHNAYNQAVDAAKVEYSKSLKFYGAAKSELSHIDGEVDNVLIGLRNEVYTQFAHTYLRLGMLLAREDTVAYAYVKGAVEEMPTGSHCHCGKKAEKDNRKSKISANDAIREALSIYESLGQLRKQEAAYAYFQLACYQGDCCLKFSNSGHRNGDQSKGEGSLPQRAKQYLSLAERNWQKALEFYSAKTHPVMYLTILLERAALLSKLSGSVHSHAMLEGALSCLLEARHVEVKFHPDSSGNPDSKVYTEFWSQLQLLLKNMLVSSQPRGPNMAFASPTASSSKRVGDAEKLKQLYRMSLKSMDFCQLHSMNNLWTGVGLQDHNQRSKATVSD